MCQHLRRDLAGRNESNNVVSILALGGFHLAKKITLFNHKGGVSKTTTAFNLGWMLAVKGKRVLLVDTDPQCNLTGMVMGYHGPTELERFYKEEENRNIKAGLSPAFDSQPKMITAVTPVPVNGREGLYLLPGHIRLAENEVTLSIAQELSASIATLQNLPGSISYLLDKTAESIDADYTIVDMNPSVGPLNQNLLMTSDYFMVPTSPDFFSVMAIDSLASVIPRWFDWASKAKALPVLKNATYPFPDVTPKFLGTIVQKFRPRNGAPAQAFKRWVDQLNHAVSTKLVPELEKLGMTLPASRYAGMENYCLATIADFNGLIAQSQEHQTPVFALTPQQLGQSGSVLDNTIEARDGFYEIFSNLADKMMEMTV